MIEEEGGECFQLTVGYIGLLK